MRALLLPLVLGCSVVVSDLELPTCSENAQCDVLNARYGIAPGSCRAYVCGPSQRCELRLRDADEDGDPPMDCVGEAGTDCDDLDPRRAGTFEESCDGTDNDCDLLIDEETTELGAAYTLVADLPETRWVTRATGVPFALAYEIGEGEAGFSPISRPNDIEPKPVGYARSAGELEEPQIEVGCTGALLDPVPPPDDAPVGTRVDTCQTHAECDDGIYCNGYERCEPLSEMVDAIGCRSFETSPCSAGDTCDEARRACVTVVDEMCDAGWLATAPLAPIGWFAATVSTLGCDAGQLRVGFLTEGIFDGLNEPGRNVLLRGDERRSTSYTGIDLLGPGESEACTGASRSPSVAGVSGVAIASHPAAPADGRRRPQALVAWTAEPLCVEGCAGSERTVEILAVWHEQENAGGVDIGWVNAANGGLPQPLDTPVTLGSVAVTEHASGYVVAYVAGTGIAMRAVPFVDDPPNVNDLPPYSTNVSRSDPAMTPSISIGNETVQAVDADEVALTTNAIAWIGGGEVWWSRFDVEGGGVVGWSPARLGGRAASDVDIVYSESGVFIPGAEADGTTISEANDGGWAVVWREGTEIHGARISEATGEIVRQPQLIARGRVSAPIAMVDGGELRVAFHEADVGELRAAPGLCGEAL